MFWSTDKSTTSGLFELGITCLGLVALSLLLNYIDNRRRVPCGECMRRNPQLAAQYMNDA